MIYVIVLMIFFVFITYIFICYFPFDLIGWRRLLAAAQFVILLH
ncbi:hypothetical protein Anas_07562 [Armadillidium nasatum]|uniref:Uncharacterized protein n=1 Tax=Armadillidium nasatum TaxID=96803 RepID=A0A5N5SME3_9CRUS|nr:hypothetical protein Anas_07562 [Armadillidium nasatum]